MSVILAAPGRAMLVAPGRPALWRAMSPGATPTAPTPAIIAGPSGWWDAGTPGAMLDPFGATISSFGAPVGALADKSGAGSPLAVYNAAANPTAPLATPRLNALLGGVGRNRVVPPALPAAGQQLPAMDPDQGLVGGTMPFGAGTAWTCYLVWSRPNWRQTTTTPSPLLTISGNVVLAADNTAGSNRLVLFPGAQQTVLTASLTRRHTHAVILRNNANAGVDVWLDGTLVATAAANPLPVAQTAPLLFLHDGTRNGGAECWFHEAATWPHALSAGDIATLVAYQARWVLGARKGVQILVTGQSNAGNALNDGAWHLLAQGVAWHLGALAYGVIGCYGSQPAATCIHGEGIYPLPALGFTGSFLNDPGDGSSPAGWRLGGDGLAVETWLNTATYTASQDAADIVAILWPWSENDSARLYTEKSTYEAAARRFLALERGMLSRSTASLPQLWWSAIPFAYGSNDPGMQMQREVVADMAADATQNVTVALPQTADSLPRSVGGPPLVYDPATGIWSGGDSMHRDSVDNRRFGCLAAPLVARAVLAVTGGDTLTAMPTGIPAAGGPAVAHVWRQSSTTLVVTVQHDGGTDLMVPATQAATGAGWAVMDGGSVASPGPIVAATACQRLNPTQLQLTLTQPLANSSAACRLFYPYGATTIGRGNAVTDNLSMVTPPTGWNIAADLGSAWSLNMPVHVPMATSSGMALSDTP